MKKRNKIITGLVIGGAIASVLGMKFSRGKDQKLDDSNIDPSVQAYKDDVLKPKRKGIILRMLDWLERNN